MAMDFDSQINIVDSDYTDAATLKAALNGVMLYVELATPDEYELVNPIPNAIMVDENGTERAIGGHAPFACDSNYSISVKNLLARLNS